MSLLTKIKKTGLKYTFAIAFNRLVPPWLFRCRRFVVLELDPQKELPTKPTEATVSLCETDSEFESAEQLTYFKREMRAGSLVACQAKIDEQLVGAFWAASEMYDEPELGVRLKLEPHQAWLFAALVDKQYRGKGIYNSILEFIIPALVEKGFTELLVAVNPDNRSSHYVHKKYSSRQVGTVYAFRFSRIAICWSNGSIQCDRFISLSSKKKPIEIKFGKM